MFKLKHALAVVFLLGFGASPTLFAGLEEDGLYDDGETEAHENASMGASEYVNPQGEAVIAVRSQDVEERTLLFKFDSNRQVIEMQLSTQEPSPLLTDMFLGTQYIRGTSVKYIFKPQLSGGYRIRRTLAIPTGTSHDTPTVQNYSPWHIEIPYGMQGTDYLQREWDWPAEHNGVIGFIEYEGKGNWGFFELTRSKTSDLNRMVYYKFDSPTPMDAEDLAHLVRTEGWPKYKQIGVHEFSPKEFRKYHFDRTRIHSYNNDEYLLSFHGSEKYREMYDVFSKEWGNTQVVPAFKKLLELANSDYKKGLKADPQADDERKKLIELESYWAVLHFLSISSSKNLSTLWTHFEKEIISVIYKDPESLEPRAFAKLMNLGFKDRRLPILFTDIFIGSYSHNEFLASSARHDIELWLRNWMISSPEEVYEVLREVRPSKDTLFLLKEILATIPHNKLDPRLINWVVQVLVERHSGVEQIADKEELAIKDLKRLRRDQPNLWNAMISKGTPVLDSSCKDIIAKLGASKTKLITPEL